ncbi:MAG: hypothetical protein PF961_21095 [Planctomycetota bacterium]|jgi:hypothetical protein|nr:hypothetical protein [Planctomycetota bacterium]
MLIRLALLLTLCGVAFAAASPADQVPGEDDWWLPDWVQATADTGFYAGYDPEATEIKLVWRDLEPSEGQFDWSSIEARLAQIDAGTKIWVRLFASDRNHVPDWLVDKHSLPTYRYMWPNQPYYDIIDKRYVDGDFIPIWQPEVQSSVRSLILALRQHPIFSQNRVSFAYMPHAWRWNEFSIKWIPELIDEGYQPADYLAWWRQCVDDYALLFDGDYGKLVYTGDGKHEWIEWAPQRIGWSNADYGVAWQTWSDAINLPNGSNAMAQHCLDIGCGARSGFTEVFNRYSHVPGWGTSLQTEGAYRYSVTDDNFPLIAEARVFGTENEDFYYHWEPLSHFDRYHYWKMAQLNALRLRMNWIFSHWESDRDHPALTQWVKLSLGKTAHTSPDAWCVLRQYRDPEQGSDDNIRNFERWLEHRVVSGDGATRPQYRIDYLADYATTINNSDDTEAWSYEALATDKDQGQTRMYFRTDPEFLSGSGHRVMVKMSYRDDAAGDWRLRYVDATGAASRVITGSGDGAWKTVSLTVDDMAFTRALSGAMDFCLEAGSAADLVVRMVRVIRLDEQRPGPAPTPQTVLRFDFGPAQAPVTANWLRDAGAPWSQQGDHSYGWSRDISGTARDRNLVSVQRDDTVVHLQKPGQVANWRVSVPNGQYRVWLRVGDPAYTDSRHQLQVEGQTIIDHVPSGGAACWAEATLDVEVIDAALDISPGPDAINAKINAVTVTTLGGNG